MSDISIDVISQRIDLWLWHARFFKTRTLAARIVSTGHIRLDGRRVEKPSHHVRAGQILTITQHHQILVVQIRQIGNRRGPPAEAQTLYASLDSPLSDIPP